MKGCRRLERGCPEAEPPVPKACADRMNAEIRFHTDILNVEMVKCSRGLDDTDVTEGTHVFSWLNSKEVWLHTFTVHSLAHPLIFVMHMHHGMA